jgi:hypothetical protein
LHYNIEYWWKALATHYQIKPKSHFLKFDPNDWFCAGVSDLLQEEALYARTLGNAQIQCLYSSNWKFSIGYHILLVVVVVVVAVVVVLGSVIYHKHNETIQYSDDCSTLLGAFFSFVFLYANNISSIVCIVSNFIFTP